MIIIIIIIIIFLVITDVRVFEICFVESNEPKRAPSRPLTARSSVSRSSMKHTVGKHHGVIDLNNTNDRNSLNSYSNIEQNNINISNNSNNINNSNNYRSNNDTVKNFDSNNSSKVHKQKHNEVSKHSIRQILLKPYHPSKSNSSIQLRSSRRRWSLVG